MNTDALAGKAPSPLQEFFYFGDDGNLAAPRYAQYKVVFQEQRGEGFDGWQEQYSTLRVPKIYNLSSDPFEEAGHSIDYNQWRVDHLFLLVPAQQYAGQFLATFREFPPSQKAGSFSLDAVLQREQQIDTSPLN